MSKALVIGSVVTAATIVVIMLVSFPIKPVPAQPSIQTNATVQIVASHLQIPRMVDFADDGRVFFTAMLKGNHLRILQLDTEANKVISSKAILQGTSGGLQDVEQGTDGYLYILTSNTDGRGFPTLDDDKILRITSVG